jgi:2-polyprenyl-3-methyl-5-hydroxy-6-metoxy-1,4-benzoquinol methylase
MMKKEQQSNSPLSEEKIFLDKVSGTYVTSASSSQDRLIRELAVQTFAPFINRRDRALELGCSDGYMTRQISRLVDALDVIEGSKKFVEDAQTLNTQENTRFIYTLFEEYETDVRYDYVFATFVLEHVMDVNKVLAMIRSALKPDGLLFVVVPNANALSRQLAYHMGLITDLKGLTENDLHHGHRRVYDRVLLNRDLTEAGFVIISQGGILLKLLADFQMDKMIDLEILQEAQLNGLYKLGFEYPDLCGSLFAVCKLP